MTTAVVVTLARCMTMDTRSVSPVKRIKHDGEIVEGATVPPAQEAHKRGYSRAKSKRIEIED